MAKKLIVIRILSSLSAIEISTGLYLINAPDVRKRRTSESSQAGVKRSLYR